MAVKYYLIVVDWVDLLQSIYYTIVVGLWRLRKMQGRNH